MAAKRAHAKQKPKAEPVPAAPAASGLQAAPWVDGMRQHFQQTGYYRPEDLQRLLGDPRQSVEVSFTPSLQFCASPSK